jgi:hydroxymethylbilane synthase
MSQPTTLRIATRASALALWQAEHVAALIRQAVPGSEVELVHISTEGDRDRSAPLHAMGGVGVFTREVQRAVLDGRADVAVHSLKDLPTAPVDGLTLAGVPGRETVFDTVILPRGAAAVGGLSALPAGLRVGTGSLRRQAQLLHVRPDLRMVEIRGNVPTRVEKLDAGEFDAIVLAMAGLRRLGLEDRISIPLRPPLLYPAVGQGALGIECRTDDARTRSVLAAITEPDVMAAVTAERALLARLRAGCHAPVGVLSDVRGDRLALEAVVLSRDGKQRLLAKAHGSASDPLAVAHTVADDLLAAGAAPLIDEAG